MALRVSYQLLFNRGLTSKIRKKSSIVQDKVATPPEPEKHISVWEAEQMPHYIMAERSTKSQSAIHENYRSVFAAYGCFNIQTGNRFVPQFNPWYLGMAFPWTISCAVGGYDVPNQPRWRRPEDDDLPDPPAVLPGWLTHLGKAHATIGPGCTVRLFDITRGLPQRIEGQF